MNGQKTKKEYQKVLDFWFKELKPKQHFIKDKTVDEEIYTRFQEDHQRAVRGELVMWRESIEGCLAEIIILDQFSRNIYRNQPRSFAYDGMALVLAQEAIKHDEISRLTREQLVFLYLPFTHSESLIIHESAMNYFNVKGLEKNLQSEKAHRDVLIRFGRYPHRNETLGRKSTPKEVSFLKQPGSSF